MLKYCLLFCLLTYGNIRAQNKKTVQYIATLSRSDSFPIVFNLESINEKGTPVWIIRNDAERIRLTDIRKSGDSFFIQMPTFESYFNVKQQSGNHYTGEWIKGTTGKDQQMNVLIKPGTVRFPVTRGKALHNITGKWRVTFIRPAGTSRPAIAEFRQTGEKLTGTFLTPSGDYRYLEGIVSGDSMQLSCFDGSHAYYFGAKINSDHQITNGIWAAGATYQEKWYAEKDPNVTLDETIAAIYLKPGEERIGFRFPDLDSNMVSLTDDRFKNKVVVIQIMGSWCPNCLDETAFLSEYYKSNKGRGVEMLALAYEYTTDFQRARKNITKFKQKYAVDYPMLITGVSSVDSLKTEKTLPQITPIKAFPSTIFIGKDGKVKKLHTGFYGPGSGVYFEEFKKEFEETVTALLKE
ncbi:MAG: TlpA disulfide reductase family protein [Chitinophagaceae bacterium]